MVSPAEAAQRLLAIDAAAKGYEGFLKAVYPKFTFTDFQLQIIETLDKLERRKLASNGRPVHKLLLTMPPRHAKTFLSTENFPAYYMARRPDRHTLCCSYNADLSLKFGRSTRETLEDRIVAQAFPSFEISQKTRAMDDWRTTERGSYYATGMGGSTTGRPANLLITDDPIKARQEADSVTYRNRAWTYYTSALRSRLQPETDGAPPIEILILTRWHPDDPAGRIMKLPEWSRGDWLHLNFPAIQTRKISCHRYDLPEDHPKYIDPSLVSSLRSAYIAAGVPQIEAINRSHRETFGGQSQGHTTVEYEEERALWPAQKSLQELKEQRELDEREFSSLYLQTPYVKGGNIVKEDWWKYYDDAPTTSDLQLVILGADTAIKAGETNDYTCIGAWGMDYSGNIYLLDRWRERMEHPVLRTFLTTLHHRFRPYALRGLYIEDRASGQSLVQDLRRENGIAVFEHRVTRDKVYRMNLVTPLIQGGRVHLPRNAPWLDEFLLELTQFPASTYDDQVDMVSLSLDVLTRLSPTATSADSPFSFSADRSLVSDVSSGAASRSLANLPTALTSPLDKHARRRAGSSDGRATLSKAFAARDALFKGWGE